jgi:urea transporter
MMFDTDTELWIWVEEIVAYFKGLAQYSMEETVSGVGGLVGIVRLSSRAQVHTGGCLGLSEVQKVF